MPPRTLRVIAVAAALAAALSSVGPAAADDSQTSDPTQAIPLRERLSGRLAPTGGFAYYRFAYPADGTVATVNLDVTPDDGALLRNVGFHVYAPNGKLVATGSAHSGTSPNVSADVIHSDASLKGEHVVQVFDYDPSRSADFTIWLNGLPLPAAPAAQSQAAAQSQTAARSDVVTQNAAATQNGTPAPTAPTADQPSPTPEPSATATAEPVSGRLGPGGTSAEFEFAYPGDGSVYTVNLRLTPDDASVLRLAGFEVYGPTGTLVVRGGAQPGLNPNVVANVISRTGGAYVLKLYNYHPTAAVDYVASISTAPPP